MYSGKTILIVDDDKILRSTLHKILHKSMGVTVVEAPSPKEAFEFLKATIPDAIILDMQMPYMDGLTVMEHLRKIPTTKNIPILACTGLTHKHVIAKLMHLNIDDIIAKPFQSATVIEKLRAILDKPSAPPPSEEPLPQDGKSQQHTENPEQGEKPSPPDEKPPQ